ncbi:MAG: hypothetical protein GEU90_15650 [Gemmatimonas sp.]|nr:hypothetical protein [Gemmatimonas sp.]
MKFSNRGILAAAFIVLTSSACGGAARSEGPAVGNQSREAVLLVENQSTSDMRIYVAYAGQEIRLGSVTGLATRRLDIPTSIIGNGRDVSFVASPLAGRAPAGSFSIYVAPGEEVRLVIPPTVR